MNHDPCGIDHFLDRFIIFQVFENPLKKRLPGGRIQEIGFKSLVGNLMTELNKGILHKVSYLAT